MKKSLIIAAVCGIAVVAGVVLYVDNKKNKEQIKKHEPTRTKLDEEKISYSNLNEQKSTAASIISERHSVVAQIIRETLDEENTEVSESEHKVDFDEIDNSLDRLLDEE